MPTGRVKWFSDIKGYGFIRAEDESSNGQDIFVHWSEIVLDGFKTLSQGQLVTFELAETPKGLQAKHVGIVSQGSANQSSAEPGNTSAE